MMVIDLLPFALLGGIVGLDVVSFPQAMISRPLVAATLGGALAGDVRSGMITGAILEMIALETLPVGASRYPEWGTASVVGGALAAQMGSERSGAIVLAVTVAIATGWVGGWSMYALRRLNGWWAKRALPELEAGDPRTVVGLQLRGLNADLIRGALLTALALLVWHPVVLWLLAHWTLSLTVSRAVLIAVAAAVAGSAVWRLAHGASQARWYFAAGLAIGVTAMVLL